MLKLNGVAVAAPLPYKVIINDLDGESGRNARGDLIRDRIAIKRSINLEWGVLTNQEAKTILNAVSRIFFPVEYEDPQLGRTTKTFYVGDRDVPVLIETSSGIFYKGLAFNIIEM
ncbi:hypothetical protein GOQ29_04975 [Clostridium sp. D2Q-14]|uniref:DUF6711 family protein n=1 Tax=Anaeromonas gelatinilytica TaxID=2683194 RepID=UPI00193C13EE|nr:DUF6711 family protein [Anaeromonas gelatinilytica]MBS4534969.1 hypothetical protein [Anaeromonas gelatinilytica]